MSTGRGNYTYDYLNRNYQDYFYQLDIDLVYLPNSTSTIKDILKQGGWDGFILSGGADINEAFFDCTDDRLQLNYTRDYCENQVLEFAIAKNIPLLGVCRGLQFINLYFGGSLVGELAEEHVATVHHINIVEEKFQDIIGNMHMSVNSYHNHGIKKSGLAKELRSFAISDDEVIEGLFHVRYNIIAIQWHPERNRIPSPADNKIILNLFGQNNE